MVSKLAEEGRSEEALRAAVTGLGLTIIDFDADLAYRAGLLRSLTRPVGLSLEDRACLALAERLGLPALTTDRAWVMLALAIAVEVIR